MAERAGEAALFDYHRRVRTAADWQDAFAGAFGMSIEDFYAAFGAYRTEAFPPLPHLADDRTEAVLVVVDGVPADTATAVREEFENVQSFFRDRFQAEAEFTMYVAPDEETASATVPGTLDLTCRTLPREGVMVVSLERCGDPLEFDYIYIYGLVRELAYTQPGSPSGSSEGWAPRWFDEGAFTYAEVAYGEAARVLVAGDFRNRAVTTAAATAAQIATLQLHDDEHAVGTRETQALGFLAVEWLADHAGDLAVFDYYRRLPEATSRDEAFEGAFGLTFEEFYEQFEAYREALEAP